MQKLKLQVNPSTTLRAGIKNYPNFNEEKKCWRRGYNIVVGVDEAGRGPLAGPVVAGAVCVNRVIARRAPPRRGATKQSRGRQLLSGEIATPSSSGARNDMFLRDSKKLSARQREVWYNFLTNCPDIRWGIGIVSQNLIDKINILEATKLAMRKAVEDLEKSIGYTFSDRKMCNTKDERRVDFIILDGNFTLDDLLINQKAIVRADERVYSCAAASIIAKVTRDRIMLRYAKKYPQYGFDRHKGYGTSAHLKALINNGPSLIHRKSFQPVKKLLLCK